MKTFAQLQIVQRCFGKDEKYFPRDGDLNRNLSGTFHAQVKFAMNRPPSKIVLAIFVTAMLLYYNAAWAMLRCCHIDEHGAIEEVFPAGDLHDEQDRHSPSQVDCLSVDYQAEISAGPVSTPQLHRGMAARTFYVNDLFVPKPLVGSHWKTLCGNTFTRGSPNVEPSVGPLYLYLSSLRI
jgi:hypothetical protein